MTNGPIDDYSPKLFALFCELQRSNRFVGPSSPNDISLLATHLLIELDADASRSASDFVKLFQLDKIVISRAIKELVGFNLISSNRSLVDSRFNELQITEEGRSAIEKIDAQADQALEVLRRRISEKEFNLVVSFLAAIGDGLRAPPGVGRVRESEYRVQQRRITRALGLLTNRAWGSSLTSLEFHVLRDVVKSATPLNARILSRRLHSPQNTISQTISSLADAGLLKRTSSKSDNRKKLLRPSVSGRRLFESIELQSSSILRESFASVSKTQISKAVEVLTVFILGPINRYNDLRFVEVDLSERNQYLEFYLTNLLRLQKWRSAPNYLLFEQRVFGLQRSTQVEALALFSFTEKTATLDSVVWGRFCDDKSEVVEQLLELATAILLEELPLVSIIREDRADK
jgi:DNA-binding MarR family transcriptional regulator